MNGFLQKAKRNKEFLAAIEADYPDEFYDWKTTITFYIALHLVNAYLVSNGKTPANTHIDLLIQIDDLSSKGTSSFFDEFFKTHYFKLYEYSRYSRYDSTIINDEFYNKISKKNYEEAKNKYFKITQFLNSKGVILN